MCCRFTAVSPCRSFNKNTGLIPSSEIYGDFFYCRHYAFTDSHVDFLLKTEKEYPCDTCLFSLYILILIIESILSERIYLCVFRKKACAFNFLRQSCCSFSYAPFCHMLPLQIIKHFPVMSAAISAIASRITRIIMLFTIP